MLKIKDAVKEMENSICRGFDKPLQMETVNKLEITAVQDGLVKSGLIHISRFTHPNGENYTRFRGCGEVLTDIGIFSYKGGKDIKIDRV